MGKSLRVAYGGALVKLGEKNDKVAVMGADLAHTTQTGMFKDRYPKRFYNMGITEANVMCTTADFAHTNYIPLVNTFALFNADRAFEQIRNFICYTNCNVKLGSSHSGLYVGEGGGDHQSIEDIALIRELSHMTIFVPCDPAETERAVMVATEIGGPVYIRAARPVCDNIATARALFIPDKANVVKEGNGVCLIAYGLMIPRVLEAATGLEKEGLSVAIMSMHTVEPIDKDIILKMNKSCKAIITVEEHSVIGGLGSAVAKVLTSRNGAKFATVDIEDEFGKSGKPDQLFKAYGLTATSVAAKVKELLE